MLRLQCPDYSSGEWSWFLSSWKRFHPCKYQSDSSIKFNCLFNQCEKAFCPAALRESTKNFSKKFRPKTIKLVLCKISLIVNIGDFEFNALYSFSWNISIEFLENFKHPSVSRLLLRIHFFLRSRWLDSYRKDRWSAKLKVTQEIFRYCEINIGK